MNMDYVSYKIDEELKNKIIDFYQDYQLENNSQYIIFFAKQENVTITIYESKKGYKVVFAGDNALYEAKIFNPDACVLERKEEEPTIFIDFNAQIGSDEVGFGDFFGPLVVVACYIDGTYEEIISKIDDSKKLDNKYILSFIPQVIDKLIFSKLTVHNEKYNQLISQGYNMNSIKAILHNQALVNLSEKVKYNHAYIDKFCEEKTYYAYLATQKKVLHNITFKTKAESSYPSVALASMIARYCFLKEMEVLNEKYSFTFPKGASKVVDSCIEVFVKEHSLEDLNKVCKKNFINYRNFLEKDTYKKQL